MVGSLLVFWASEQVFVRDILQTVDFGPKRPSRGRLPSSKIAILRMCSPSRIKTFTCGNGRADKRQVAAVVVSKFPELKLCLAQDRTWKERFHQNMCDAVALGVIAISA